MDRVKIRFPASVIFTAEIVVRVGDINYGGHLGNDRLIGILQEARALWLRKNGYTELDIEGFGIIQADLAVQYKAEAFAGELLHIHLSIGQWLPVGFTLYYQVVCEDRPVATAFTNLLFRDYRLQKTVPVPVAFRARVSAIT